MLRIVNMIPRAASGEARQDSEPNIAVNPENPLQIVATAFTRDPFNPIGGRLAPLFLSNDGGLSWELRPKVPDGPSTLDITVGYGTRGGTLYAGILRFSDAKLSILRSDDPFSPTPMTVLVNRGPSEDQPWITAATSGAGAGRDRVYIGHNDSGQGRRRTASVFLSQNARTAAAPAGFATDVIERRRTAGQDGPPIRPAVHPDGTVYVAFQRWVTFLAETRTTLDLRANIVVMRDDAWGDGANPFSDLTAPGGVAGVQVATNRFIRFTSTTGPLGQERIGGDMAIAVDPSTSDNVWVAWCDRVGGPAGTDWTIHVRRSTDRGQTWTNDVREITNAKNPAIAVNTDGLLGFMFQQLVGIGAASRWVTQLELTADAWATPATTMVLHSALAAAPARTSLPYLGDYIRLLAVERDFYGVFSGSNLPDLANFPSGVTYQRNVDFAARTLLAFDNATPVAPSIDPFFVHYHPDQG